MYGLWDYAKFKHVIHFESTTLEPWHRKMLVFSEQKGLQRFWPRICVNLGQKQWHVGFKLLWRMAFFSCFVSKHQHVFCWKQKNCMSSSANHCYSFGMLMLHIQQHQPVSLALAWCSCTNWCLSRHDVAHPAAPDSVSFLAWCLLFQHHGHWCSQPQPKTKKHKSTYQSTAQSTSFSSPMICRSSTCVETTKGKLVSFTLAL